MDCRPTVQMYSRGATLATVVVPLRPSPRDRSPVRGRVWLLRQLMALFEPHPSPEDDEYHRVRRGDARAVGDRRRERLRRPRLRKSRVGLRLHVRSGAPSRAGCRRSSGWASKPGDRVLEVGVGTGINALLYPRDCSVTGHRPVGARCSRRRASASPARASATCGCSKWMRPTSSSPTTPSTSSTRRI